MQKLSEDKNSEKGAMHAQRKKDLPTKGGSSFSFSSDQRSDNTLLTSGGRCAFVFGRLFV